MDTVINKISEVESAASAIMDDANNQKRRFAETMNEKTLAFDRQLEADTDKKLEEMRTGMEQEMKAKLSEQKEFVEQLLLKLEQNYDEGHSRYVDRLFQVLLEE